MQHSWTDYSVPEQSKNRQARTDLPSIKRWERLDIVAIYLGALTACHALSTRSYGELITHAAIPNQEEEMSSSLGKYRCIVLLAVLVSVTPRSSLAQSRSRIGVVRPALGDSLTVSAVPSAVAFNLAPGASAVG